MKIKIALIPSEHTSKAQGLSSKLQNAMEGGEMSAVDQLTEELISLTDSEYSLSLSEELKRSDALMTISSPTTLWPSRNSKRLLQPMWLNRLRTLQVLLSRH